MHPRIRKITLAGGAVLAMLGAVGCGSSSSTAATDQQQQQQPSAQAPAGPSTTQLASAAKALGVTTAELQKAMEATRPAQGEQPSGDMATSLAEELGVSKAKVQAALGDLMPQGAPSQGTPPQGTPPTGTTSSSSTAS